jgi:signal transduction histidine kinase
MAPGVLGWPTHWWARQSLRARLTLIATALFAIAVVTGAVLVITLQRYSLLRVLDSSAAKAADDVGDQIRQYPTETIVRPTTGGISEVQVVDRSNRVIAASPGGDTDDSLLTPAQLAQARTGARIDITSDTTHAPLRVLAHDVGNRTVLVVTDLSRVDDSIRVLTRAALIGGPVAVLLMGGATYLVVALTLRPVAALRHGASDITASGLAHDRLPVPSARDEIYNLAVTLNAMLDRIDSATKRQRTFVGDAAHELRSPLASLRVQLEVAQRLGPEEDWKSFVDDVLLDVGRLDRLVNDLLSLARMDENVAVVPRRQPVRLDEIAGDVVAANRYARVPVALAERVPVTVTGDPDGLRRVLVNLVDNAVRHATGSVEIAVESDRSRGGSPEAVVRVTDDGPGIPPEERERVFDRFYRLEASRSRESGGTGLGLPIVRDLIRAHNGTVRLRDRPDGKPGLQAVVRLPAANG